MNTFCRNEFGGWSTDGVELDEEESTEFRVVCQAYHLTSFAVLVSIRDEQPVRIDYFTVYLSIKYFSHLHLPTKHCQ